MTVSPVDEILAALGETDELPRAQVAAIVEALGADEARRLLDDVIAIEASGGMMTADGARRRTPGGVFFLLARQKLQKVVRNRIFFELPASMRPSQTNEMKEPATAQPRVRTITVVQPTGRQPSPTPHEEVMLAPPIPSVAWRPARERAERAPPMPPPSPLAEREQTLPSPPLDHERARRSPAPESVPVLQPRSEARAAPSAPPAPAPPTVKRAELRAATPDRRPPTRSAPKRRAHQAAGSEPDAFDQGVSRLIDEFAAELIPVLRRVLREEVEQRLGRVSTSGARSPKPRKPPSEDDRVADAGERIVELVASDPGIGIGLLAAAVYGEDTPTTRNRIYALKSKLKTAGRLPRPSG